MFWENLASMSVFAWRSAWFSGANLGQLRRHTHNEVHWGNIQLTLLWINHMYFFLQRSEQPCQTLPALPWMGVTGGCSACGATAGA